MLPAAGPFFLVLVSLFLVGRFVSVRPEKKIILSDLVILSGVLVVFGVFDSASLRHFFRPDRPMDWIPLLATATFAVRTLFSHLPSIAPEAGTTFAALLILLLPLLRQTDLSGGTREALLIYVVWMAIRLVYPTDPRAGIDRIFLLPLFLAAGSLSILSPLSGSLLLGQLAGGMAAVTGAMALAAFSGKVTLSPIEAGWVLGALLLIGRQYVDISQTVTGLLAGSLFLGGVSARLVRKIPAMPLWGKSLLVIALTLLPLIAAIIETLKTLKEQGGGGY